MKRIPLEADRAVMKLLGNQGDLIMRSQLLAAGWTEAALRYRTRVGGEWATVLPGIYTNHSSGTLTSVQREIATVLYAGPRCVITGGSALRRHGVPVPMTDVVDVLIPDSRRRATTGFVRVLRTARIPERPWVSDGIRWAPVARAVADVARGEPQLRDVSAVVAAAVHPRNFTVENIAM